jgi:hypothetical protein
MRAALFITLLGLGACTSHNASQTTDALTCAANQTAVYTNRFTVGGGASGVATPPDAAAGVANTGRSAQPATNDPSTTAMTATCGPAICPSGQVAVSTSEPTDDGGGVAGTATSEPSEGVSPTASSGAASSTGSSTASSTAQTAPTVVCVPPPPACEAGLSPQYSNGSWQCTDCALVVTYGSEYGNSSRCVSAPTDKCHGGDVPTWSYDDDKWECQPECDNGSYDQHEIAGQTVCVPC